MEIIAHRGALYEELENSFASFDKAIEVGASRIELDTLLTADHQVAIMHDRSLLRTCGVAANIDSLTRKELEGMRMKNAERIPFLDEVCERYLDKVELNIEIKGPELELAEGVAKIVRQHKNKKRIIVSSFHAAPLELVRTQYPEIELACLFGRSSLWPNFGHSTPIVFTKLVGSKIVHPMSELVDENFMDQARARGWFVYAYCETKGEEFNEREKVWNRLMSLGVDGLCTNYPRELKSWLNRNKTNA